MTNQITARPVRVPDAVEFRPDNPFFERVQEINNLITRRAYELFEAAGPTHGHDREHWLRAESEILLRVPVEITETEDHFSVRADVSGFADKDIEVRVEGRILYIAGRREAEWTQTNDTTIHSERRASQIFRVLELPSQIDTDRVSADLADGILRIELMKTGRVKKIPVLAKSAGA